MGLDATIAESFFYEYLSFLQLLELQFLSLLMLFFSVCLFVSMTFFLFIIRLNLVEKQGLRIKENVRLPLAELFHFFVQFPEHLPNIYIQH